ncbi:sensor protein, partial [Streptomyces sp. SID14478]|nr:sensor protein [Streptomyces sp. SID14478]
GAERKGRPATASSAARTRNGLVKRPQRSAIAKAVHESDTPRRPAPDGPVVERSPEDVSGMLSGLRSAHMRGAISVEKERASQQEAAGARSGSDRGEGQNDK